MRTTNQIPPVRFPRFLVVLFFIIVGLVLLFFASRALWYFEVVENDEIGIKLRAGQIIEVVQPGIVSDFGLFVELVKIKASAVSVLVDDNELITLDKQRIGLEVTADVFRPRDGDTIRTNYSLYRSLYTSDNDLRERMKSFSLQAMKVCVGNKKFDDAVIGSARDALRTCIDDELGNLTKPLGLVVRNVAVPQVTISPEVQTALDAIVQSRLSTEKAKQDVEKAKQESLALQAIEEGKIRVDQSKLQEAARQQVTLQQLKQQQLEAELKVIEQQKLNSQSQLELTAIQQKVAKEQAQVDLAKEIAMAEMYASHPDYVALQIALANASAIKPTDKFIFTQAGVFPNIIISNSATTIPALNVPQ